MPDASMLALVLLALASMLAAVRMLALPIQRVFGSGAAVTSPLDPAHALIARNAISRGTWCLPSLPSGLPSGPAAEALPSGGVPHAAHPRTGSRSPPARQLRLPGAREGPESRHFYFGFLFSPEPRQSRSEPPFGRT